MAKIKNKYDHINSCYFTIDDEYECILDENRIIIFHFCGDEDDKPGKTILCFENEETAIEVFEYAKEEELICTSVEGYFNYMYNYEDY